MQECEEKYRILSTAATVHEFMQKAEKLADKYVQA